MILAAEVQPSDLLSFLLRSKDWLMVISATAYFDESGTDDDAPDLCLAGYIFKKEAALQFDVDWRVMLDKHGLNFFHMKECVHIKNVNGPAGFGPLSMPERDAAARDAIAIIQRHASRGIAISLDKSVQDEIRAGSFWGNPYAFVAGQTMFGVRAWADAEELSGTVAYLFEAGAAGWGQAHEAATKVMGIANNDALRDSFRIASFTSAPKLDEPALQAADMLAWHWRKHLVRRRNGEKKRKDFAALLKVPTDAHHYDRAAVDFLGLIRKNWAALAPQAAQQRR